MTSPKTLLEADLRELSRRAAAHLAALDFKPAVWSDLHALPRGSCPLVWVAPCTPAHVLTEPRALYRAVALRQLHDPEQSSEWAFVPSPDDAEVWLVRRSGLPPLS